MIFKVPSNSILWVFKDSTFKQDNKKNSSLQIRYSCSDSKGKTSYLARIKLRQTKWVSLS